MLTLHPYFREGMQIKVYNTDGKETGKTVKLPESIFGIKPNDHAIYLDVKRYMAGLHRGTHKAKERSEVDGSTKKLKRQKGTGGARAGSIRNPLYRKGGRVFGPRTRDYDIKLNKKVKVLARNSALAHKAKSEKITVVEDFALDSPKTKSFHRILMNLKVDGKSSLLVLNSDNKNVVLSARNIPHARVTTVNRLNTYDIMHAANLVFCESSVGSLEKALTSSEN